MFTRNINEETLKRYINSIREDKRETLKNQLIKIYQEEKKLSILFLNYIISYAKENKKTLYNSYKEIKEQIEETEELTANNYIKRQIAKGIKKYTGNSSHIDTLINILEYADETENIVCIRMDKKPNQETKTNTAILTGIKNIINIDEIDENSLNSEIYYVAKPSHIPSGSSASEYSKLKGVIPVNTYESKKGDTLRILSYLYKYIETKIKELKEKNKIRLEEKKPQEIILIEEIITEPKALEIVKELKNVYKEDKKTYNNLIGKIKDTYTDNKTKLHFLELKLEAETKKIFKNLKEILIKIGRGEINIQYIKQSYDNETFDNYLDTYDLEKINKEKKFTIDFAIGLADIPENTLKRAEKNINELNTKLEKILKIKKTNNNIIEKNKGNNEELFFNNKPIEYFKTKIQEAIEQTLSYINKYKIYGHNIDVLLGQDLDLLTILEHKKYPLESIIKKGLSSRENWGIGYLSLKHDILTMSYPKTNIYTSQGIKHYPEVTNPWADPKRIENGILVILPGYKHQIITKEELKKFFNHKKDYWILNNPNLLINILTSTNILTISQEKLEKLGEEYKTEQFSPLTNQQINQNLDLILSKIENKNIQSNTNDQNLFEKEGYSLITRFIINIKKYFNTQNKQDKLITLLNLEKIKNQICINNEDFYKQIPNLKYNIDKDFFAIIIELYEELRNSNGIIKYLLASAINKHNKAHEYIEANYPFKQVRKIENESKSHEKLIEQIKDKQKTKSPKKALSDQLKKEKEKE